MQWSPGSGSLWQKVHQWGPAASIQGHGQRLRLVGLNHQIQPIRVRRERFTCGSHMPKVAWLSIFNPRLNKYAGVTRQWVSVWKKDILMGTGSSSEPLSLTAFIPLPVSTEAFKSPRLNRSAHALSMAPCRPPSDPPASPRWTVTTAISSNALTLFFVVGSPRAVAVAWLKAVVGSHHVASPGGGRKRDLQPGWDGY